MKKFSENEHWVISWICIYNKQCHGFALYVTFTKCYNKVSTNLQQSYNKVTTKLQQSYNKGLTKLWQSYDTSFYQKVMTYAW